jgi:hypothetical protein
MDIPSLELNHFITKYEEKSNRDGKKVNVYCLNYGLAKKNNIIWGRAQGTIYRKYFIERIFNFTSLVLEQIRETKSPKTTRPDPTVRPPSRYQTDVLRCANGDFPCDSCGKIRNFRCVRVVFGDFVIMVLS